MRSLGRLLPPLLALAGACKSGSRAGADAAGEPRVPPAPIDAAAVDEALRASRERQEALDPSEDLDLLELRFRRMNLVALGRHPESGRAIHTIKNESPEFRALARSVRADLGDGPVDVLGEKIADRAADALMGASGVFRLPMSLESFSGETISGAALEILAWARDLPLIVIHHDLVADGNRSVLSKFTVRTLLRVRWNIETERPAGHALAKIERIAYLEFIGRHKRWGALPERRQALEELAALVPDYPIDEAIEALVTDRTLGTRIVEEQGP